MKFVSACMLLSAVCFGQGALDPAKLGQPPTDNWPTFNGDYTGRRFSTLSKINATNINSLGLAWVRRLPAGVSGAIKGTPIQVNGVLYYTMPDHVWAVDARTVETVRLGDNAATYGVGPKKMTDGYAYIMPMRGYINLGFYQGAVLKDPGRLLEGTGKGLRHVKVRSLAEANRPPVRALVATALARRRSVAGGPARASTPRRSR